MRSIHFRRPLAALSLLAALVALLPMPRAAMAAQDSGEEGIPAGSVVSLRVADVIGPASADFISRGIDRATRARAALVVIELDTPGGLDTSMRAIIQKILASHVPIATFVYPEGARAASAGTYILYASHIAAMAPATNLGAATPVSIGGGPEAPTGPEKPAGSERGNGAEDVASNAESLRRKAVNDATAYIRGLAELRGRNAEFAERAVREGASLPAEAAKREGVVDYVAHTTRDLLQQLDGATVTTASGSHTLALADAPITALEPGVRTRVLAFIANPQVAVVLMMIGIYGLFFEFTSPGFGVPGIAGAIFLLLGLYAFHVMPINWAGVALMALGAVMMLAELFMPSFGALGIGGIIAMLLGGLFLVETEAPGFGLPLTFLLAMTLVSAVAIFGIGTFAARSRARPVVSGREQLLRSSGIVTRVDATSAWAQIEGENWQIQSSAPLAEGMTVHVVGLRGLTLIVEPAASSPSGRPAADDLNHSSEGS
ncbi:MAG TPA: nodulation protein NfeD [Steroidobacteraceae bacterium]|nr:nodulation protein NfeD [Steroidobacteraceae bacterium]